MSIDQIYAAIKANAMVHELMANAPLQILERSQVISFEVGKFNLYQGEKYTDTYLLVEGRVKVYLNSPNGKSVVLDVYQPGMFLGEQEAVINKPYSASIINITPVKLLKMTNNDFVAWLANDQAFANRMIVNLSEQIYHLTQRVERYSLYSAMQQIGLELLRAVAEQRPISREQLTYYVDTSYRNINRVLKQFAELGLIDASKPTLKILNITELQRIIKAEESSCQQHHNPIPN